MQSHNSVCLTGQLQNQRQSHAPLCNYSKHKSHISTVPYCLFSTSSFLWIVRLTWVKVIFLSRLKQCWSCALSFSQCGQEKNSLSSAEMAMTEWKSECASESAQARESEAHFSVWLLLPSLYFLRG